MYKQGWRNIQYVSFFNSVVHYCKKQNDVFGYHLLHIIQLAILHVLYVCTPQQPQHNWGKKVKKLVLVNHLLHFILKVKDLFCLHVCTPRQLRHRWAQTPARPHRDPKVNKNKGVYIFINCSQDFTLSRWVTVTINRALLSFVLKWTVSRDFDFPPDSNPGSWFSS